MPLYMYQAFSRDGKKTSGYIDAQTADAVKGELIKQGLYPISISISREEQYQPFWKKLFARAVTTKDKIFFTKQLSVLLRAGVPLLQSIELLSDQFPGQMRTMLISIKDDLREGSSFANALNKYPKVFDKIYVQLVRAGEASGKLDSILDRLTLYIERREDIKKRVKGALTMPIIQLVMAMLVVGVLLTYVVPQMASSFAEQARDLPWPTQMLLNLSDFLTSYWFIILGVGALLVGAFLYWRSTPRGAYQFDAIKLRLPLIGYFTRISTVVQFCQTLGILLESGVNLAESLDIVCKIIDNRVLADALNEARDKIVKQGKIAQYLKQTHIFPPIATYMISTGEESGKLDFMLLTIAENYEEELKDLSDKLTASLTPILLVVMSLIVGFIVIAIAMPIIKMGEGMGLEM